MASGDVVGSILMSLPPATSRAEASVIVGTSSPVENFPSLLFDDASTEYWDFLCALEGYDAGGLTIEFVWAHAATSGNVVWGMAIRRINDDAEDLDTTAHDYTTLTNNVTAAVASASGEVSYDTITFTNGADMDSLADTERFMLRVSRAGGDASDTASGDAKLLWPAIIIRET